MSLPAPLTQALSDDDVKNAHQSISANMQTVASHSAGITRAEVGVSCLGRVCAYPNGCSSRCKLMVE